MCQYCDGEYGKSILVNKSPDSKETQPNEAVIFQLKGDKPRIVLFRHRLAQGHFKIKYCPICGRKLV
ncbi:hypothetical protein [Clostridium kluyveri]|uniref:Uncharacterized protein n=1 Tax=Clostridium kluyveri (strain ATCC 8527 / DSM 555 / NBRC 12016 / NCIMB 10680 / K1) TaxID=431943 RepID=A5MYP3_CLOK5|nr:hypothetical protein [Clostridium kluyveri]ABS30670.1 Hypothetical protein CKL_1879 [Clostridium kluyveri DSM 555]EDK33989.1 Hypothetical protein CKL_1977 [Clostridium kluyveri DSM 555]